SHALRDQAGQSLVEPHAHPADARRLQTDRRSQHQLGPFRFEQVNGTDIGMKAALDQAHNVDQRLAAVVTVRDELTELDQAEEEGALVAARRRTHGAGALQDVEDNRSEGPGSDGEFLLYQASGARVGQQGSAATGGAWGPITRASGRPPCGGSLP